MTVQHIAGTGQRGFADGDSASFKLLRDSQSARSCSTSQIPKTTAFARSISARDQSRQSQVPAISSELWRTWTRSLVISVGSRAQRSSSVHRHGGRPSDLGSGRPNTPAESSCRNRWRGHPRRPQSRCAPGAANGAHVTW
jgi:hypothetical protein